MTEMVETTVNGRWSIALPDYRAERVEWSDPGWEVERLDSMHANLKPGDVVYDVGTEEGDLSGLYGQWGCRLVLVEPNPHVWPNVRAIWRKNLLPPPLGWWTGFASNRTAYDRACRFYGNGGEWPVYAYEPMVRGHGFSSLAEHRELDHPAAEVRLDDLWHCHVGRAPDAVTVDVEGAEMLVLEGAAETLDAARPLVWVSVHDEMIRDDYGYTSESCHQFMALHGYRMQLLAIDHECHWFYWPKEREAVVLP